MDICQVKTDGVARYNLTMERTDATCDEPHMFFSNKAKALKAARMLAKSPSWDCVALWVNDSEGNGIQKFILPVGD